MANFKTHITTSTLLGAGLGAGAWLGMGYPFDTCLLSAGLCSIAGMLPDLDSPNSVPVRETVSLSAAIIPAFMLHRFERMGLSTEEIILVSALIYFGVRFGIAQIFKRYTVHRGMWHSIPSAMIASLLALFICTCDQLDHRLMKGIAVFVGFISHLVLDEIYSIDLSGMKVRIKKSSGTALKFWSGNAWANFSTYAKLGLVLFVLSFDPMIMNSVGYPPNEVPEVARVWLENMSKRREQRLQRFLERRKNNHAGHDHGEHQTEEAVKANPGNALYPQPKSQPLPQQTPSPALTVPNTGHPNGVNPYPNHPGYYPSQNPQPSRPPNGTSAPAAQPRQFVPPQQLPIQRWQQYQQPRTGGNSRRFQ